MPSLFCPCYSLPSLPGFYLVIKKWNLKTRCMNVVMVCVNLSNNLKPDFHSHISPVAHETFADVKCSDMVCCPKESFEPTLVRVDGHQIREFH